MRIHQFTVSLSLALIFAAAASRPSHAGGCTEAKMKADRQHVGAIRARGDLRIGKAEPFWQNMSYGQKSALADRVVCAVMGPNGSVYSVRFVVTWRKGLGVTNRIVGVWSGGRLTDLPLRKLRT